MLHYLTLFCCVVTMCILLMRQAALGQQKGTVVRYKSEVAALWSAVFAAGQ